MQHNNDCLGRRSVADEAKKPDLFHPNAEGTDVGTLESGRILAGFIKGTDLSVYTQTQLNAIAGRLNERPKNQRWV
jgi:hypothetical protein